MARKQVGAIDAELLERVDLARGDVPRTRLVERLFEAWLTSTTARPPTVPVAEAPGRSAMTSTPAPSAERPWRCRVPDCDWPGAGSPSANCPVHPGRLVPAS